MAVLVQAMAVLVQAMAVLVQAMAVLVQAMAVLVQAMAVLVQERSFGDMTHRVGRSRGHTCADTRSPVCLTRGCEEGQVVIQFSCSHLYSLHQDRHRKLFWTKTRIHRERKSFSTNSLCNR